MTEPIHKTYKVVKPYQSRAFGYPLLIPVGTRLSWWDERQFFLFDAVDNHCAWIDRWPVEAWHDYFQPVEEA